MFMFQVIWFYAGSYSPGPSSCTCQLQRRMLQSVSSANSKLSTLCQRYSFVPTIISFIRSFSRTSVCMLDRLFVRSFGHPLIHSSTQSLNYFIILSFTHSLIRSFTHSLIRSFAHSVIPSFRHSVIPSFRHSVIPSFRHSFGRSVVRSFGRSVVRSFGRSVVRSFGRSVVQSFSHSIIQSFYHSIILSLHFLLCNFQNVITSLSKCNNTHSASIVTTNHLNFVCALVILTISVIVLIYWKQNMPCVYLPPTETSRLCVCGNSIRHRQDTDIF